MTDFGAVRSGLFVEKVIFGRRIYPIPAAGEPFRSADVFVA